MEDGFGAAIKINNWEQFEVLILVLVEDGFGEAMSNFSDAVATIVLILVLVEDGFGASQR